MNVVSDFRAALVTQLTASFRDAEVRSGRRQGVSRDMDRINVFFEGWRTSSDRVVVARPVMIVRYWKARSEIPSSDEPTDPQELEQASIDLLSALRAVQELPTIVRPWFFIIESVIVDDDPEEWGVEARLTGMTANVGVIA